MPLSQEIRTLLSHRLTQLLSSREHPKTICPSEVAGSLTSEELKAANFTSWRDVMPDIRELAAEMRGRGEVEVLQKGVVLERNLGGALEGVVGPIRLRKVVS